MLKKQIKSKRNLDTRSAAHFVQLAGKFEANITIEIDNKKTSCKSLMGLISLGVMEGQDVLLTAEGVDAAAAVEALEEFVGKDE